MTLHISVTIYVYPEPKMCTIELIISYLPLEYLGNV